MERHPALDRLSPLVGEWSMQTSFGRSSGWTRRARTCSTTTTPGVTRLYSMTFEDGTWTLLRDKPDFSPLHFSQRYVGQLHRLA